MKIRFLFISLFIIAGCFLTAPADTTKKAPVPLEITVTTPDSIILSADLYVPVDTGQAKFPLVVLMHMMRKDRSTYSEFIPLLLDRQWAVLNVDLRGHGKSDFVRKQTRTPKKLHGSDFQEMPNDLGLLMTEADKKSSRIDSARVALVGASIGSSVAVFYGATHPAVKALVLLSPGLDYRGMKTELQLRAYGKRPVLILVGKQDKYSHQSSLTLEKAAKGKKRLAVYDISQHGTDIFNAIHGSDSLVVDWLHSHL